MLYRLLLFVSLSVFVSCSKSNSDSLFTLLDASQTGIDFTNEVKNGENMNIFKYRNFYNGGGVAIGDINNDGLADIFFISNQGANKLYLNKGDFKFEDISVASGIQGKKAWSTGVVMVDINGDGFRYLCSGCRQ